MRLARIRGAPRSAQAGPRRRDSLTTADVHSAQLAGTRAGTVTVWVSPLGVRRIEFGAVPQGRPTGHKRERPPLLDRAVRQLEEYFAKERTSFDLELHFPESTTDFQFDVYRRLLEVEYGHVISYGRVASDIGRPDMARAVGQAVGANPLPILVPCHRVIASDGSLTGFGGGLRAKAALLTLEGIEVDGVNATSRVHPEVIPLDL